MYSHPHWQRREHAVIARMAEQAGTAPRGLDHEYTRLMARSKYHPRTHRSARQVWKQLLRRLADWQTSIDGLPRP